MPKIRVMPTLLFKDVGLVKGVAFDSWRRVGSAMQAVKVYNMLDLFHTWWGAGWTPTPGGRAGDVALVTLRRGRDALTASFVDVAADRYYVWEMHVWCERAKVELSHSPEILELSGLDGHPLYTSFQVLTQRERFQMEHEPVLPRLMETLAGAIVDPDAARVLLRREIESQTFSAEVLRCLETPGSFEGRAR